ncbi:MAG TPA: single-stranded-DNA-specific exonuclease RecJ [Anaerolineae bacterium]|nr:single-stranded-DNA-specific exonuclease RecJ [Anaerolineae bacterium]
MRKKYRHWLEPKPILIPPEFNIIYKDQPFLAEGLARRGIYNKAQARAYLNPAFYKPQPVQSMLGVEKATERIINTIQKGETIGIWGDFDVDGQTATTLLVSSLRACNAKVQYHIPIRATESHGIKIQPLKDFLDKGIDLLITCDTGISAVNAINYAKEKGVDVIITDHHNLPSELPDAFAIVNPKLLGNSHPLRHLSGVGTAFQLAQCLEKNSSTGKNYHVGFNNEQLLDLVALGTVADVSQLIKENRYYVQKGIEILQKNTRLGLKELLTLAEIDAQNITEEEISYVIAPRMNAIGRLADANPMVEFLTTNDISEAKLIATNLEGLNNQRRLLVNQVYQAALSQLDKKPYIKDQPIIILSHPNWPGGVIGIVASRIVEKFQRPVILFTTSPGELSRGSARSIEGIDIQKAISAHNDLLASSGGHSMAAGLSIEPHLLPGFQKAMINTIKTLRPEIPFQPDLQINAFIPLEKADENLMNSLNQLAPFGPGNPKPIFVSQNVYIKSQKYLGNLKEHLQLLIEDRKGTQKKVIWWQAHDAEIPEADFNLAYTVRSRVFKGKREIQLEWIDCQKIKEDLIEITKKTTPISIIDLRHIKNPNEALVSIMQKKDALFWAENIKTSEIHISNRYNLQNKSTLVIITTPPDIKSLQLVIQSVCPENIYLLGIETSYHELKKFIKQLGGLIQYVIKKKDGYTNIRMLAAASGQTERTIQKGLAWFKAHGEIQIQELGEGKVKIIKGGEKVKNQLSLIEESLSQQLAETAAFRRYYLKTDPHLLIENIM